MAKTLDGLSLLSFQDIPIADLVYQAAHVDDDERTRLAATNIFMITITTLFVLLKLLSRRISKVKLAADDYVLLVAYVLYWGLTAICLPRRTLPRSLCCIRLTRRQNWAVDTSSLLAPKARRPSSR